MAITNYGELQSAVADWSERSDLTARIEDFIRGAHDIIAREIVLAVDIDLDGTSASLPSDCREVVALYAMARPAVLLSPASASQMENGGTGVPRAYLVDSGEAVLYPTPDQAYGGRLLYRLSRSFFASDSATNAALTRYPMLYLHGALAELMRFMRDADGEATYQSRFQAGLVDAIRAEREQTPQGGMLQTSSGNVV